MLCNTTRCKHLNQHIAKGNGPVLYWMERDQRAIDNWALFYASLTANNIDAPMIVVFVLDENYGHMNMRHYDFLLKGLIETAEELKNKNSSFLLLKGDVVENIINVVKKYSCSQVYVDFNPLTIPKSWRRNVAKQIEIPLIEVDAHNIVPVWEASDKLEFAAYTFRPKIHKQLKDWLELTPHIPKINSKLDNIDISRMRFEFLSKNIGDSSVLPVDWLTSGTKAGMSLLWDFLKRGHGYAKNRNDPNKSALSNLSPYLHFGQISAQRVAVEIKSSDLPKEDRDTYLEEVIVRRELSDNFCYYNNLHDKLEGAHAWAKETLEKHRKDKRDYIYSLKQFESADTHEELWNAMQTQLVTEGKLHGWCRMYWAKKILEWTKTPEFAIKVALYLNDRYNLDGSDPNGVVGVMWSIAGVHDRAWTERPVFGKIRYMNYNGAKRKFDVNGYIERYGQVNEKFF